MKKINFLTAGESHGKGLLGIIEGMPSGIEISSKYINAELGRRQKGFGRGGRMKIENDKVDIYSGLRHGKTLGSPIGLVIRNLDWDNWKDTMSVTKSKIDILAIGIGHDVSRYYNKAIKITDVKELVDVMITQLSKLFDNKKKLN